VWFADKIRRLSGAAPSLEISAAKRYFSTLLFGGKYMNKQLAGDLGFSPRVIAVHY
jgi:hypothetical protein